MNKKLPLDGVQWRVFIQMYKDSDGKEYLIQIWKSHHSMMDGVSCMGITAYGTDEYTTDYFVKSKSVPLIQQILLKLSAPFYLIPLFMNTAFTSQQTNCMSKNKGKMTGNLNCSSSKQINMKSIKELSKKLGVTINDVVMCSTSCALKEYFRIRNDPLGKADNKEELQVLMPANIRF